LSGIVKSTIAQELYEYRPTVDSSVKVLVTTKLTLESQAKSNPVSGNCLNQVKFSQCHVLVLITNHLFPFILALGMQSKTIIFEVPPKPNAISNAETVCEYPINFMIPVSNLKRSLFNYKY
jgi:hypothetical protein